MSFFVAGIQKRWNDLGQVHRNQAGPHDDANALGIFTVEVQTAVFYSQARCPDRELHCAAHYLDAFPLRLRDIWSYVEVAHFAGDSHRVSRSVETPDFAHSALAGGARRPER